MTSTEKIRLRSRYQRAIRIDHDFNDPQAIDGYFCSHSAASILSSMVDHITTNSQCAFTWTGPYGSGKSSLVVFLSALLGQNKPLRERAFSLLEQKTAQKIIDQLGSVNWRVIPVVGRRENPAIAIGESLELLQIEESKSNQTWNESRVIKSLKKMNDRNSKMNVGTILFVDEMGKFLESAADEMTDLYLFQQLAELACRSNGRFIFIGVLHQAFGEYSNRLNQTTRIEWEKIQGRFVDLTFRVTVDEQVQILGRAIGNNRQLRVPRKCSRVVANAMAINRKVDSDELATNLEKCWPLHPAVACLLGPLSQSQFGQNQRSIFSFLSSKEPCGFQDFLQTNKKDKLYEPYLLWEYLRLNLESSIYASSDGHRWALAVESVDRCEAQGSDAIEVRMLKTIAVLDFLRNRSGLVGNLKVLRACMTTYSMADVRKALAKLQLRSLIVYRKFIDGYSIFAGSDFDIDEAVTEFRNELTGIDFSELKMLAGIQPILAKRHYHEFGALRWCDVVFAPLSEIADYVKFYKQTNNTAGLFVVAVPTQKEPPKLGEKLCRDAGRLATNNDIVFGLSKNSWKVADLYEELLALQRIGNERLEIASDGVARREIQSRIASLHARLVIELNRTMDSAIWFLKHHKPKLLQQSDLSLLASELADRKFNQSPKIHIEIINRNKPSNNAIAAQNALLRKIVLNVGKKRLGIEGYPPEYAFFSSLLEQTGIYIYSMDEWRFQLPEKSHDNHRVRPIFDVAYQFLKSTQNNMTELSRIYEIWRDPPYGVKDGLMPVFIVAFILSLRNKIAFYRDGVFQVDIKDIDVEYLTKHPESTSIRLVEHTQASLRLLSRFADLAIEFNNELEIRDCSPINVARGLVSIFENLPEWTIRTNTLSSNARKVRTLFKQATDPNKFLFDDLPDSIVVGKQNGSMNLDKTVKMVHSGILELVEAYPKMLERLRRNLLKELRVKSCSKQSFQTLRERAQNIAQVSGDFRLEAFIGRLAQIENSSSDIEGLASLAVGKLPKFWVDSDFDKANLELAKLARSFVHVETFASVKGRDNKRQAWAILLNTNDGPSSLVQEFDIADSEQDDVNELAGRLSKVLSGTSKMDNNVILAALAKISTDYMDN